MWRRSLFVGYAQNGLRNGATMATPQFINVGASSDIELESLVPTGDDTSDNVEIQLLTAGGNTESYYTWNDWMYENACWVDADLNEATGVTFAPGQGLWVMGASASQGLQAAGKVGTSDVVVALRNGGTATGNPFPVSVDLNDIVPTGDDLSDNVEIQILTPGGNTDSFYTWNDWMYENPCWVDADLNEVTDVTFAPGQGLWVMGSSTEQGLRFPAPEL